MRKIFFSVFILIALVVEVSQATKAVFSDTGEVKGNTISAATVNIDFRSEPKGLLPKPLNVSGLVPTQFTGWARGVVYNAANSTPVKVYMYVENISGGACDKTRIEVYTGHAADGASSERGYLLYGGALNGLAGSEHRVEVTGHVFNLLNTNTSAVIQQRAQLDGSADNSYQNKSCTWDEVFVAETPTY